MKVLITGGTGFVGAWTAKAVQDAGHQVRFLVRNPDRLEPALRGSASASVTTSSVTSQTQTALPRRLRVVTPSFIARQWFPPTRRSEEMLRTNLEGARNVLGGAAAAKMDPIIHVSSFSALFRPGLPMRTRTCLSSAGPTDTASPRQPSRRMREAFRTPARQ